MKKFNTPELKTSVATEAFKEQLTAAQIASKYEIHPQQIRRWKNEAIEILKSGFSDKREKENKTNEQLIAELYKTIGKKEIAIEWLKKNLSLLDYQTKVSFVNINHPSLSLNYQTQLLDISRNNFYHQPIVNPDDIRIMGLMDKIFTDRPFYGSRRITQDLKQDYQEQVNRKRVQRLMREMGIEAIYPKPNTSPNNPLHLKYPYLLKNLSIIRSNQVWGTDITYIRLLKGFCYLVAIIDWYSRYVIAWTLSETMEIEFCLENLQKALNVNIPEVQNSDQGSHFTSPKYTKLLTDKNIQISMDGRGRCMDNIFTERLWRSLKYEDIYIHDYRNFYEARMGINKYFNFYNDQRRHQSLNYRTPAEIYFKK